METTNQYLTFTVRSEHYALAVNHIREVLTVPQITRIPRMPDYMSGVINVRGSVVPVIDLGLKFGLGKIEISTDTAIIVGEIPVDREDGSGSIAHVGLFADSVEKVIPLEDSQIEPPPKIGSQIDTEYIGGMGHVENDFIVILDVEHILTTDELTASGAAAEENKEAEETETEEAPAAK